MNFKIKLSLALIVSAALAACGGGGGGGGAASTTPITAVTPPVTAPTVTPGDLQTTVPALTYAPTSQEYAFVTTLNAFRGQLGLGLLAQNPLLDTAASNHLHYVLTNDKDSGGTVDMSVINTTYNRPQFHIEDSNLPLFTGIQEIDRARHAGYAGAYVGEEGTFGGGKGAVLALNQLFATVYHRAGLMFQFTREIGVAVGTDASQTVVMEEGYQSTVKPQYVASDFVGAYPADKQTNVPLHAGVETPNPFPELSQTNTDFPTKTSYPICIAIKEGQQLTVTAFTVTESGQATPLDVRLMTKANDPNKWLAGNIAFIVGKIPFKPNTTYNVSFSGTANSTPITKTWSFTTSN